MAEDQKNKTVDKILKDKAPKKQEKNEESNVAELEQQLADTSDKLLRAVAEKENLRERHDKDLEKAVNYSNTEFAKDLMEVMENFHRAVDNTPEELQNHPEFGAILKGIELTKTSLDGVFSKHHISRLYPLGEKFDHHIHQAVKQVESDEESGTVIEVLQAGYNIKDRVLRPAMVVVAA